MTSATIEAITFDQALRLAVESMEQKLVDAALTRDQLDPGTVWSLMQDVCIRVGRSLGYASESASATVRITRHRLPVSLRNLYDEAMKRSTTPARGSRDYVVNYHLAGLIRTVRTSLADIPSI
jgi:hypothetical protein